MLMIDETKLTYGTLQMIGQDYEIENPKINSVEDLRNYADKVVEYLRIEESS